MRRTATWWAPGRVTVIGDHTDYTGGWVLPIAIGRGTTVTLTFRDSGRLQARSALLPDEPVDVSLDELDEIPHRWGRYVGGAVALARRAGLRVEGLDVLVAGDLPAGAGLSSSAALVCATLAALSDAGQLDWTRGRVAHAAQQVEHEFLEAPVGVMDPFVVMHARDGHALLLDTRSLDERHVPLPLGTAGAVGPTCCLLVVDAHVPHTTAGAGYVERVRECEQATTLLGVASLRDATLDDLGRLADDRLRARVRHVVTENRRVLEAATLLRNGRLQDIGPLLTASHRSLRDDFAVSTPALDLVVAAALDAGALGARLTGAGFGGSVVVLAPTLAVPSICAALGAACVEAGTAAPTITPVAAGGAARRTR